jgi:FkbM family methyltransferase
VNPHGRVGRLRSRVALLVPARARPAARYWERRAFGALEPGFRALVTFVTKGSLAVDVGANYGVCTYAMLRAGAERVVAFEPNTACAGQVRSLGSRVTVHEVALGRRSGSATLHVPATAAMSGWASLDPLPLDVVSQPVEVRTLDQYCLWEVPQPLSVLKVDVEGLELDVLAGAGETLRRCRPVVLVEVAAPFRRREDSDAIASLLRDLGYKAVPCADPNNLLARHAGASG